MNPSDPPTPAGPAPTDGPLPPGPTLAQRAKLVRAMQAKAMRKAEADPLKANLGVRQGDLALVAHTLFDAIGQALAGGGTGALADPQVARALELALKVSRQEERFARFQRLPTPSDPASDRVRRSEDRGF